MNLSDLKPGDRFRFKNDPEVWLLCDASMARFNRYLGGRVVIVRLRDGYITTMDVLPEVVRVR